MSPRAAKTLSNIQPILLTPRRDPFDDPTWLFEPKYDGFRGLLYVTPSNCTFYSKRGLELKQFADLCPELRDQIRCREAILDGEVIALDHEGHPDFGLLMRRQGISISPPSISSLAQRPRSPVAPARRSEAPAGAAHPLNRADAELGADRGH